MSISLSDYQKQSLLKFNERSVERLTRSDIGTAGFPELESKLTTLKSLINELILLIEVLPDIPSIYVDTLFSYIDTFNANGDNLLDYRPEQVNSSSVKSSYVNSVDNLYSTMLTGYSPNSDNNRMSFVSLYTLLKQRQADSLNSSIGEAERIKQEFSELKIKTESLLTSLQDRGKEVTLHDYSKVFSSQANLHSNWNKSELGSAQIWLIATIAMIILFITFVCNVDRIYPIDTNQNGTIITIEYLTRVLIISFLIYVITFCAKQFNIQQHLSTVNKHRENTLNSYKLFIDSMGESDSEIKQALMMEVAKAIYESGQTGYLTNGDKSDGSPSLIELTKYVGGNKG